MIKVQFIVDFKKNLRFVRYLGRAETNSNSVRTFVICVTLSTNRISVEVDPLIAQLRVLAESKINLYVRVM